MTQEQIEKHIKNIEYLIDHGIFDLRNAEAVLYIDHLGRIKSNKKIIND